MGLGSKTCNASDLLSYSVSTIGSIMVGAGVF